MNYFTFFIYVVFIYLAPISSFSQDSSKYNQQHPSIHELQYTQFKDKQIPQERIEVITGFQNLLLNYMDRITGKNIGIVTNHTGVDKDGIPIWERLKQFSEVKIVALFSPEHGLFGEAAAGEKVKYDKDIESGPRIYSLYGKTRKPTPEMLESIDLILYDIQDIGVRFYTYISTLGLVLEAAGESNIPVWVLDRPNPLTGSRVEGPVLELKYQSFVGFFPIPIRYGLTAGELALMMIGEHWIKSQPKLEVVPLIGWNRDYWFDETTVPWTPTSPNIPDLKTATVYPGICFIEATNVSEGRGTDHPFLWIGAPWLDGKRLAQEMNKHQLSGVVFGPIEFTPKHLPGIANNPKYEGQLCQGIEITVIDRQAFESVKTGIILLTTLNSLYSNKFQIYPDRINRLFGTDILYRGLNQGLSAEEIVQQYGDDLEKFKRKRQKYFLY